MWLIMRGALDDKVAEIYRFYIVPASNIRRSGTLFLRTSRRATVSGLPRERLAVDADQGETRSRDPKASTTRRCTMKICVAGEGAFGQKHLDALRRIRGVEITCLVGAISRLPRKWLGSMRSRITPATSARVSKRPTQLFSPLRRQCIAGTASR